MFIRIFSIRVGGRALPHVRRDRQHGRLPLQVLRTPERHRKSADIRSTLWYVSVIQILSSCIEIYLTLSPGFTK